MLNKAARHYDVPGFASIFDNWRGDITLVAEPAEFSGAKLPPNHYFTGPLIARQNFPLPEEIRNIPRDQLLIYFAMGSSGTPEIVAKIIESFAEKPYRVIAPVKFHLAKVPGVKIPSNVIVTEWLLALQVNKLVNLTVIHGGIGTVMTAAYAGKPVVGVGMQPEQDANIACLVRKGFAIRVPKSKDPSVKIQQAIQMLLHDEKAIHQAAEFSRIMEKWDGPKMAAQLLYDLLGKETSFMVDSSK
jgi:UDP:flavonoid glycosyltransferase YjiC (YdhE family)